ncbi:MAG: right-handed parallel beta-helix repeat-containing protein, partial [Prevotella sp.]|nr:right-handed parallel beta-helix repeat-containing protein [Prevotella sp.]
MKRLFFYIALFTAAMLTACSDDDSFTTNPSARLTFSRDTVSLDTIFSTVPTSTYTFWVYNTNGDGLRLRQVRLQRGNQSGFRVNVGGSFLDNTTGSSVSDLEIRKGDSIRVFVELTSGLTNSDLPQLVEDNIVFSLE